jgi:nicotinamidase-related amidase
MEPMSTSVLSFDPQSTALVLIDLQNGVMSRTTAPYTTGEVMARCVELADALRKRGSTVIYVRVDVNDILHRTVDAPGRDPNAPPLPASASELAPGCGFESGDLVVTKRSWGAFYGTDLDQQLRRRNVRTIVMGGVATNMGVESTARAAFDRGYDLVFAEDAMSSLAAEAHEFAIKTIFPRMGRVRSTEEILKALAQ